MHRACSSPGKSWPVSEGCSLGEGQVQPQNLWESFKVWDTDVRLLFQAVIKVMGKFTSCTSCSRHPSCVLPCLIQGCPRAAPWCHPTITLLPGSVGCLGTRSSFLWVLLRQLETKFHPFRAPSAGRDVKLRAAVGSAGSPS